MERSTLEPLSSTTGPRWPGQLPAVGPAMFRRAIGNLDAYLSRRQGVASFSDDERCILRFAPTFASSAFTLSDGAQIRPGDLVIDIHCWNERIPRMPKGGADLRWAHHAAGRLRYSLELLAQAVGAMPELRDARACRARVNFVGQGSPNASVSRIVERLGFEDVDEGVGSARARMHDAFENVLIGLLVWTHNPEAWRRDKMIRQRRPVWTSRAKLLRLHGHAASD